MFAPDTADANSSTAASNSPNSTLPRADRIAFMASPLPTFFG